MTNMKKIGLTALAASLVSTSVSAGALTVSGGASLNAEGYSGSSLNRANSYSMGNQLTFTGGGELENGLNVSLRFVIDQADDTAIATAPFDSHSLTLSSDGFGTLTFAGEGGDDAAGSINTTAAGDIWDTFDGIAGGVPQREAGASDNSIFYTTPSLVEGLSVFVSVDPSSQETDTGYGLTYKGVEGLSASYAITNIEAATSARSGNETAYALSYAYGPITGKYSNSTYELGTGIITSAGTTVLDNAAQETTSMAVSYTVSENFSVSYGRDAIKDGAAASAEDAEFTKVSGAYTSGGLTVSVNRSTGDNVAFGTAATQDLSYWGLGASFAF